MRKKSILDKKASDMTIGESLKISGVITLITAGICAIPVAIEYRDEIKSAIKSKFNKNGET